MDLSALLGARIRLRTASLTILGQSRRFNTLIRAERGPIGWFFDSIRFELDAKLGLDSLLRHQHLALGSTWCSWKDPCEDFRLPSVAL